MAEEDTTQPAQEQQPDDGRTTLHVREHDTKTAYANVCMLSSTAEEMVLNFGLSFPMPQNRERRSAEMLITNRVIMGLPAAKRLTIALSQAIQRYENTFGVIELRRQPPAAPAPTQPPPQ